MAQIKQLKDVVTNQEFYPVTHKDAIVGIEDIQVDMTGYATELWVEELNYLKEHQDISNKVDISEFEEATLVTSAALNALNLDLAAMAKRGDDQEATNSRILEEVKEMRNLLYAAL